MRAGAALALRTAPALVIGGAFACALVAPGLRIPGHRGGFRVADGFRPGRWDSRFVVARGPASFQFPPEPLEATLVLSGPAKVTLGAPGNERVVTLEAAPAAVTLVLPQGGAVSLGAPETVRLHEVRIARTATKHFGLVALAVVAAFAGAAVAIVLRTTPGLVLSVVLAASVGAAAVAWDSFASLALVVCVDRFTPSLAMTALAGSFLPVLLLPRPLAAPAPSGRLPALFAALGLVSCVAQVLLTSQPLLIGDPAAYHEIGGRFRDALRLVRGLDDLADAMQTLRPYGGLAAIGVVYGVLRAISDSVVTIYLAQAAAMAAAIGLLSRAAHRLGGQRLAILTGVLALLYPTFPILCGIVQPEPFILLAWTWALDRFLAFASRGEGERVRDLGLSALAFALGLALHPQGIWFLLAALALIALPFARRLADGGLQRQVGVFVLGLLPVVLATAAGEAYARPATPVLEDRHGFWAYTAPFPLGFWLFIDTDGWQGPVRIADTRYARGFARARESASPPGRLQYTARFVAANAGISLRTVLRNAHRLLHLPDNPFRRDWVLPYAAHVRVHRVLVVLFLLAAPLALAGRAAPILVPVAILLMTYPLYHVFNKYAVPATPFLLLGAALALGRLASERDRTLLGALAAAGVGAFLAPADLALLGVPAGAAHGLLLALHWGGLLTAFVLVRRSWAHDSMGRVLTGAAALVALVPSVAAAWGDPSWRAYSVGLARAARHEVVLGAEDLARVDGSREAYVLLDLRVPSGDPSGLRLAFDGGPSIPGSELQPTMPTFGLATFRGGIDPRSVRQWWRLPWRPGLGRKGKVALTVQGAAGERLYGDLDGRPSLALSLGQWPYLSVYRLMHDGEYRLAAPQALAGTRASSTAGRELPGSLNVRIAILGEDAGGAVWETAPAAAATVVTGIWARISRGTPTRVEVPEGSFPLELGTPVSRLGSGELRFLPTGEREGWLVMRVNASRGKPVRIAVRPLQAMSFPPPVFLPEIRREPPPLPLDWVGFPYTPARSLLEARPAPPWSPALVY